MLHVRDHCQLTSHADVVTSVIWANGVTAEEGYMRANSAESWIKLHPTFAHGTVPNGALTPLSPALKLSDGTYLCVPVTSKTQCAAVSTCSGLTMVPVHHS